MSLRKQFATDKRAEAEGILYTWLGEDGLPVFRVRLARSGGGNLLFEKVRERVMEPYRRLKDMDPALKEKLTREVFAEAVTIPGTWQMYEQVGLKCKGNTFAEVGKDEAGKPVYAWTPEVPKNRTADGYVPGIENAQREVVQDNVPNVAAVFNELPELFATLAAESMNVRLYRAEELEADSKN